MKRVKKQKTIFEVEWELTIDNDFKNKLDIISTRSGIESINTPQDVIEFGVYILWKAKESNSRIDFISQDGSLKGSIKPDWYTRGLGLVDKQKENTNE